MKSNKDLFFDLMMGATVFAGEHGLGRVRTLHEADKKIKDKGAQVDPEMLLTVKIEEKNE